MDESEIKERLVAELKELRKGSGCTNESLSSSPLLMAAYSGDAQRARVELDAELDPASISEFAELRNAFGQAFTASAKTRQLLGLDIGSAGSPTFDLTERRQRLSDIGRGSFRTITRREDVAIELLAERLARKFVGDTLIMKSIDSNYKPIDIRVSSPSAKQATDALPSDIVGLVKYQQTKLTELGEALEYANSRYHLLMKVNETLARHFGVS
ncbi:hypothetical protein [Rhodococcus erythropolis]|uniref:hypothetical protein n=1 Tax=Rhodococcus erythropolis TaxID=1833 RepID=UPI003013C287